MTIAGLLRRREAIRQTARDNRCAPHEEERRHEVH
jgi:hypothetical protein